MPAKRKEVKIRPSSRAVNGFGGATGQITSPARRNLANFVEEKLRFLVVMASNTG